MHNFKRHSLSAVLAASLTAVALGACTRADRQDMRTEGRQATTAAGQTVDNATLTTRVKTALLADDDVKGTQINVDSNNGIVTLTGTVDTPAQMDRAAQIARGVDGVQRVEMNLTASANAAPGLVPGTQPPGTSPAATPLPNDAQQQQPPGGVPAGHPSYGQPATTAPADPANPGNVAPAPGSPGSATPAPADPARK